MTSDAKAVDAHPVSHARANPLDILEKEGCKIQSLTVSDQHATLLVSHPVVIDHQHDDNKDEPASTTKTISSLLKLTLIPFHKALLGSNPVISPEDIEIGQLPERNLLEHNPLASEEIISFLLKYNFALKSESGAEYSYYAASPNLGNLAGGGKSAVEKNGHDQNKVSNSSSTAEKNESSIDTAVSNFGAFDIELISPASAYQISRVMPSLGHVLIHETPEMYNTIVKPYIQSIVDSGSLSWIKNVIEVKKEKERLLVNHDEFVINVDTKWRSHPPAQTTPREEWYNHPSTSDLYCLGIVKTNGITCLRDLRKEHVNMLKEMENEGLNAIKTVYGVQRDQIRVFIHYQPQFYHFHVHFTRLENEFGCSVERSHLMSDVIQNLEDSEYYCKRVITYKLKKGTPLQNLIENHSDEAKADAE
mmetsp:Transcript_21693/g.39132  ORF Transcript_21693/g.39132 Transcript_21693/m.39132 type:complete len:419 (+) Transcript_21693:212-1468(+)|eukprot:CAMPEP_0201930140 /NCGR_PEP_ID=MMETSP0903-20130614/24511_1 /ASSEMBLY_ACC=CAM_ASM_000552 /TAXON_ID=420261 /ORGANISM="Thalassiosira antarctica, Strain CCMP982" /LENGTH=418 /DNA_ID=CAMNT_0048469125 /DNA_START=197 /DNA_END=1450 /DNA_ORIENTATION=+